RLSDEEGQTQWQWPYSAFGANPPSGPLKATAKPDKAMTAAPQLLKATSPKLELDLRYPGQMADEHSALHDNWQRQYQPLLGRYTQADPIGLAGGWNRFGYGEGNPLSYTDPSGLNPIVRGVVAGARRARDVWRDTNFDGPRPSKTKPGEGMVCQIRYKQQPVFRIDVHPLDPMDRTPVPHWHMAPDMQRHREMPDFIGDWMKGILGEGR
ncbi:MAG: RHS repeat domain-containing protein, partial [Chloroflexota bacterium]